MCMPVYVARLDSYLFIDVGFSVSEKVPGSCVKQVFYGTMAFIQEKKSFKICLESSEWMCIQPFHLCVSERTRAVSHSVMVTLTQPS